MAWSKKHAMQEYLMELTEVFNLYRKEYGTVMSSEANENGKKIVKNLLESGPPEILRRDMHAPAKVASYLAYPCARTDLQVRLAWCLMGIKRSENEASNDSKLKEQGTGAGTDGSPASVDQQRLFRDSLG